MADSHPAQSSQSKQDEATRILQAVRMLAAAFPRAAWRAQSDAAYTMALLSSSLSADEVNVAVRDLIRTSTELPTVADIITMVKEMRMKATMNALRCPSCGSALVAAVGGRVVLCFDCDWEAE